MFGDNAAQNDVCGALTTLTRRTWCDGIAEDPDGKRRRWLRRWNENGSNAPIFGPDNCPADPVAPEIVPPAAPAVERAAPSGPPRGGRYAYIPRMRVTVATRSMARM